MQALLSRGTDCICVDLKGQAVIDNCSKIFITLNNLNKTDA